jgi:hypothetical protein
MSAASTRSVVERVAERVERRDVEAALEARRELGPAYEDETVDNLVAKIERASTSDETPACPRGRSTWISGFPSARWRSGSA